MVISEVRIQNFRSFEDTDRTRFGRLTPIVGRNDVGKSGILHALRLFFEPPKRGGLSIFDFHKKDDSKLASIEVAFKPESLLSSEIQIDAKNKIHIIDDKLVDSSDLLRLRISFSQKAMEKFEILIKDIDDDELFPLALKNHDELYNLLKDNGLPAKRAGKETNQEKRNTLRKNSESKKTGYRVDWVDAFGIEKPLRKILPNFIFFTDFAKYGIGETSVQNQFKGVVDRALSGHPDAQKIEDDIKNTIQIEFDKLYNRLSKLTDTVSGIKADPKVSWKKAVDGIGLTWTDSSGVDLPFELRGAGIRRLFMVAYFQYETAESLHDPDGPKYIFAIEEPEIHLHPGAQRDLEDALKELSALGHSVVYTTHSPVFASSASLDDLILVQRSAISATVGQTPKIDTYSVANELGVEASDRLIGKNYIILVEGLRDVEFYQTVLTDLFNAGFTQLDPSKILFLQCGGITNLRFVVTAQCIDEAGLSWAILVDSDKQSPNGPLGYDTQCLLNSCPPSCSCLKYLFRSCIENYLDPLEVKNITKIDCVIPKFGKPKDKNGQPLPKPLLNTIKNSSAIIAKSMGAKGIVSFSDDGNGQSEFVSIFNEINSKFGF